MVVVMVGIAFITGSQDMIFGYMEQVFDAIKEVLVGLAIIAGVLFIFGKE